MFKRFKVKWQHTNGRSEEYELTLSELKENYSLTVPDEIELANMQVGATTTLPDLISTITVTRLA